MPSIDPDQVFYYPGELMNDDSDLPAHRDAEPRVGARLAAAREAQGLSLAEIAERTRVPMRHLHAIEIGDYAGLPAATYSAGFVKGYARLVGLDGQALSQAFREEIGGIEPTRHEPNSYEPADPSRTPSWGLALFALGIAIVLGIGYLYWRGSIAGTDPVALAARSRDQPAAPAPAPPGGPAPAATPASPVAAGGPVTIVADELVWLKVYEMGGATLFTGVLQPQQRYDVPAGAIDPRLRTGRPEAIHVMVGGATIPQLGPADRLIKDVSLKGDALIARANPIVPPADVVTPVENSAAPQ